LMPETGRVGYLGREMESVMSARKIEKVLRRALIQGDEMRNSLYEYELENLLDELKSSMTKDKDDFIFAVTENSGYVAMMLAQKSGQVYINEQARKKLMSLWPVAYKSNMKKLIPVFSRQLNNGEIPINGVKVAKGDASTTDIDWE